MARPIDASYRGIVAIVRTWCDKASCRRKGWSPPRPPTGRHSPPCVLPYTPIVEYQATISITSLRTACGEACSLYGEEQCPWIDAASNKDLMVEDRNRLNGGVERIIQKTDRDETLREVCGALTKLLKRGRGEKTVGA